MAGILFSPDWICCSAEPNMPIDFYYIPGSAPCRAVLLAAKAVGVELNLKLTDLMAGEHLKPEFIKLNPQHCVPTIDDNGFALWESRAICTYLANQYGGNESLYPKDPKKRAVVDSRLYFDQGTLYQRFAEYYYPVMFGGAPFDEAKLKKLEEAYEYLDKFLDGQDWAAGSEMTLADISLASSVSTAEVNINRLEFRTRFSNKYIAGCWFRSVQIRKCHQLAEKVQEHSAWLR
ncbi:Hypothetical predicted protein [Cloeon dipterum]|uniref:Glutathione transferase n=1 Tax=Cloeon dipterum TaxID=197152 RepID=A0A8S1CAD8_9INSE|nr:Hypothetical predicted protein [Cloeon dipterum]